MIKMTQSKNYQIPNFIVEIPNFDIKDLTIVGEERNPLFHYQELSDMLVLPAYKFYELQEEWKAHFVDINHAHFNFDVVKEVGLYKLLLTSNTPEAIEFQQWVCGEVLPSIRKTGKYDKN